MNAPPTDTPLTNPDGALPPGGPRPEPPITSEVLAQWDSELAAFFAGIRSKLRALGEEEPASLFAESEFSTGAVADASLADESLDRLQQIKRRLAARLEQSRHVERTDSQTRDA